MNYTDFKAKFTEYKCQLLTSEEDVIKLKKQDGFYKIKIDYIATCNHNTNGYLNNIVYKNIGLLCKNCSRVQTTEKQIDNSNKDKLYCARQEYIGYSYLETFLSDKFNVQKTFEGCLADFIIKPKEIDDDKWLMIQLKTTGKLSHGIYCFKTACKNYDICALILLSIEDKKIWLLDGSVSKNLCNISIGATNSKYNKYLVNETNIYDKITEFYNNKKLFIKEECLKPISLASQQEQKYRRIRENKLDFLEYKYPMIEGTVYDFTINNYKIQEKVCCTSIRKDRNNMISITSHLSKSDGMKNKVRIKQSYKKGNNDYYWLWVKDSNVFYIIPESILIEKGKVETKCKQPLLTLNNKDEWYNDYKYDLDDLDTNKIHSLFT
jgi:hypothetical protein